MSVQRQHQNNQLRATCLNVIKKSIPAALLFVTCLCCSTGVRAQQRTEPFNITRTFNITGQVSLPNGRPSGRTLVKVTSGLGSSFQSITNDQGRYEFRDLKMGDYTVIANSMTEPPMISDAVTVNSITGGTNNLSVPLTLHEPAATKNSDVRPTVVSVEEAKQKIPKEALKAFRQGLRLKENHEDDQALENFGRAVSIYPEYFQALSQRGDVYIAQRKLNEAAAEFSRALKLNANYGPALHGYGYCKLEMKKFAEALELLDHAVSVEPVANTYFLLGITNLELDRRAVARQTLAKALSLDPVGSIRAHIYLANLYAREGEYLKAADELKIYLDSGPLADDVPRLQKIEANWRARSSEKSVRH